MPKPHRVILDESLCKGQACALCAQTCPAGVFRPADRPTPQGIVPMQAAFPEQCIGCHQCDQLCPELAIDVVPAGALPTPPPPRAGPLPRPNPMGGWQESPALLPPGTYFMSGNEACAEGALAAGCRFYAGYPITPSSEIMVHMAQRLPELGGNFMQMEDELGSIAAVIGAAWGGLKAMTATSGPGISLMLENIGYAIMTETPCVIVDVQRAGPSTGQASRPAQGDIMQARWGTHGGVDLIALAPWSVQEMYELTIRAFNLAERFRVPVFLLADEIVGHLYETVTIPPAVRTFERLRWPQDMPFDTPEPDGVPPMPAFGEGAYLLVTGSTHDGRGYRRTTDAAVQDRLMRRLSAKIRRHQDEIDDWEEHFLEDAERVLVACGSAARSALWAVQQARRQGRPVGLLRLKSLWPFPDEVVASRCGGRREIIVPEMNLGQLAGEVRRAAGVPVTSLIQVDGEPMDPRRILAYLLEGNW